MENYYTTNEKSECLNYQWLSALMLEIWGSRGILFIDHRRYFDVENVFTVGEKQQARS